MKKILITILILVSGLVIFYMAGPKPATPQINGALPDIQLEGQALEDEINAHEANIENLKPDNEARIIWYDSESKSKTPYSFVYLHGFSASQGEGEPIHKNIAKTFGGNLYLARLEEHGIYGDSLFKNLTPEAMMASAKRAVAIGKQLGDSVIIVSTSTGGTEALYIAAENPEIKALVCYSPNVALFDPNQWAITMPWGREIMKIILKGEYNQFDGNDKVQQYWSTSYMIDGIISLKSMMNATMTEETFQKVKCPVFVGYYYKNDSLQDHVVSVPRMMEMFDQLGTPDTDKKKVAFPKAGDHVIGSVYKSGDYQSVEKATIEFLEKYIEKAPIPDTTFAETTTPEMN